jgi:hypothetical protein
MHRRLFALALVFSNFFALASALYAVPATPTLVTGEIAGAKFTIARPAVWNRQVLLIAHGYRDEKSPLVADLFPDQLATKTLVAEGWIVAKTSYRRNGLVIADGLADLDALRERAPDRYAGAVAIGAALKLKEPGATLAPSVQPKIPLLFLTNQSELDGPAAYVASAAKPTAPNLRPVLFRVSRAGHVNVNQAERLVALRALTAWLDRGRAALPTPALAAAHFDATVLPQPVASQVTRDADARGFTARVTEVSAIYGNVFLNIQPADFAGAGIAPQTYFQITAHGRTFRVRYGSDFSDVPRGNWVAFPNADGFFWLSRNWENAAASAQLKLGDTVAIRQFDAIAKH